VAIGRYNDTTSTFLNTWAGTDPVFVIGNGTSNTNRQNAMTVLKNGKTGLGTISPHNILVIRGADDANDGPVLGLGGSTSDQEESGRIRFYEGTTSTNMRGSYIHLDAALNRFHIGIHPTTDNIVTNDEPVITIDRATGDLGIGTQTPAYDLEVNGSAAKPGGPT
jgi:hypothetical protein